MGSPDWRVVFREMLDYDLWANRLWLPVIVSDGLPEEKKIFNHILAASTVWVTRLEGESLTAMPEVPFTDEVLVDRHTRWCAALDRYEFDQMVDYRNTRGDAFSSNFGDMARQAMNHGTYHRGQLRSMLGARGAEFPETDFIGFSFGIR
jgi:uncharacterized damage-inducible protein DinB